MSYQDMPFWSAVQVLPQHEKKVAVMLGYKGYEHFLPIYNITRKWSDRIKIIERPLFPGYVFCRIQGTQLRPILATSGVTRIVSFGGKPCPVSDEEIGDLQRVVRYASNAGPVPHLQVGQKVEVIEGPLAGVVGTLALIKNRHRLVISIDLILRSISIDIDPNAVRVPWSDPRVA